MRRPDEPTTVQVLARAFTAVTLGLWMWALGDTLRTGDDAIGEVEFDPVG